MKRFTLLLLLCSSLYAEQHFVVVCIPSVENRPLVFATSENKVYHETPVEKDVQELKKLMKHNHYYLFMYTREYAVYVTDYITCRNPENYIESVYILKTGELRWNRRGNCLWYNDKLLLKNR